MQREATSSAGVPAGPADAKGRARRIKVAGKPGIYYRLDAKGKRRYEITYRDSTGKQRWQAVDGNLADAEAELSEVKAKLRRGERVNPAKATFAEVASLWLAAQGHLRRSTRNGYDSALRNWINPRVGTLPIGKVTEDHIAVLISEMFEAGRSAWTVRATLTPLHRTFAFAVRRGLVAADPCARLTAEERPRLTKKPMRILARSEIEAVIAAASNQHRALYATAVFGGLRLGEALGLVWGNIDLGTGTIRVRKQINRYRERVEPKTENAVRDVVMMDALGRMLAAHRLLSPLSGDSDPVFWSRQGQRELSHSAAQQALKRTFKAAGLVGLDEGPLRFHTLRHTFASLLIARGRNVVFVSKQLGHEDPNVTLRVYAHLFDAAEHARQAREEMEHDFGAVLDGNPLPGNGLETAGGAGWGQSVGTAPGNVAYLPGSAAGGGR